MSGFADSTPAEDRITAAGDRDQDHMDDRLRMLDGRTRECGRTGRGLRGGVSRAAARECRDDATLILCCPTL